MDKPSITRMVESYHPILSATITTAWKNDPSILGYVMGRKALSAILTVTDKIWGVSLQPL